MQRNRERFTSKEVIEKLNLLKSAEYLEGMKRFGINTTSTITFGVSIPELRKLSKKIGTDHTLSIQLWNTKVHEAMILAAFIDDPKLVTEEQMERWASDFSSWDICDAVCGNLFDKTEYAYKTARKWAKETKEFKKRAGFVLMAELAVHNKKMQNTEFINFFDLIESESIDERNFVKKAVNWALRQIGKRNEALKQESIALALKLSSSESKSAKWIGNDALSELNNLNKFEKLDGIT